MAFFPQRDFNTGSEPTNYNNLADIFADNEGTGSESMQQLFKGSMNQLSQPSNPPSQSSYGLVGIDVDSGAPLGFPQGQRVDPFSQVQARPQSDVHIAQQFPRNEPSVPMSAAQREKLALLAAQQSAMSNSLMEQLVILRKRCGLEENANHLDILTKAVHVITKQDESIRQLRSKLKAANKKVSAHIKAKAVTDYKKPVGANSFDPSLTLEACPLPIDVVTLNGRFIYCNRAFEEFVGYSRTELLDSSTFFSITHPDSMPTTFSFVHELITGSHTKISRTIKRYITKSKQIKRARLNCFVLFEGDQEKPQYLAAILEPLADDVDVAHQIEEGDFVLPKPPNQANEPPPQEMSSSLVRKHDDEQKRDVKRIKVESPSTINSDASRSIANMEIGDSAQDRLTSEVISNDEDSGNQTVMSREADSPRKDPSSSNDGPSDSNDVAARQDA